MKLRCIAPFLAAAGVAAWIAAAPTALADTTSVQQDCTTTNSGSECVSPGNAEINDSPPPVEYTPQYPYWEGDYGYGGGFHGGMGGHGGR